MVAPTTTKKFIAEQHFAEHLNFGIPLIGCFSVFEIHNFKTVQGIFDECRYENKVFAENQGINVYYENKIILQTYFTLK